MPKPAQKIKATTQRFTEIQSVSENIVLLSNGNAFQIIEIKATNFALQSQEEQNSKILSYAALLNSLSFSIQIFITNKQVDVSSYLKQLDTQARQTSNTSLSQQISLYRDFVADLVKVTTVLDKKFYIAISYSPLEAGVKGAKSGALGAGADPNLISQAKVALKPKAETIITQVARIGMKANILEDRDLIKVFYEIYNGTAASDVNLVDFKSPIVEALR